jgi:hypothetical protein
MKGRVTLRHTRNRRVSPLKKLDDHYGQRMDRRFLPLEAAPLRGLSRFPKFGTKQFARAIDVALATAMRGTAVECFTT